MNIIVMGAGAVGSYYAAKLSWQNEVLLIGRKEHVDKINKSKLILQGVENRRYSVKAATDVTSIGKNALILLTTKAYDNEKTIKEIRSKLRKDTIVLCLQNGYGVEDPVKRIIGKKCLVLRAITTIGASFMQPGKIQLNHEGKIIIEKSTESQRIRKTFASCALDAAVAVDIREDVWKKLIVNCLVNPLSAILKVKNGELVTKELEPLLRVIGQECIVVAKKEGIAIGGGYVDDVLSFVKKSENTSSMLQDILKSKKTEIDYLNGAVVKVGKRYGINCPANAMLAALVAFQSRQKDKNKVYKPISNHLSA